MIQRLRRGLPMPKRCKTLRVRVAGRRLSVVPSQNTATSRSLPTRSTTRKSMRMRPKRRAARATAIARGAKVRARMVSRQAATVREVSGKRHRCGRRLTARRLWTAMSNTSLTLKCSWASQHLRAWGSLLLCVPATCAGHTIVSNASSHAGAQRAMWPPSWHLVRCPLTTFHRSKWCTTMGIGTREIIAGCGASNKRSYRQYVLQSAGPIGTFYEDFQRTTMVLRSDSFPRSCAHIARSNLSIVMRCIAITARAPMPRLCRGTTRARRLRQKLAVKMEHTLRTARGSLAASGTSSCSPTTVGARSLGGAPHFGGRRRLETWHCCPCWWRRVGRLMRRIAKVSPRCLLQFAAASGAPPNSWCGRAPSKCLGNGPSKKARSGAH
mmetsp:Transcript_102745/g.294854  ORF Transcript_102745/g.294854 Transcript_102745/m.294854 type:complete len:382 (+) Transcript_102745:1563-2708(+)